MHVEVEDRRGLQPSAANVVRVADPRDRLAAYRPAVLDVRVDIGEHLARMELVGEPVDDGHPRVRGEALDDRLLERPDHHDVDHPRNDARNILDHFVAIDPSLSLQE